jgi:hypothetical protein
MAFKWTCPYCNHDTTIVDANFQSNSNYFSIENKDGKRILDVQWIVCPNEECNKFVLSAALYEYEIINFQWSHGNQLDYWDLIPQSSAKVFPEYIPQAIRTDYEEACSIKNLSPKASATLARRCLQGMIRDFFKEKEENLSRAINKIENKVDPLTWQSIDAIRKIGNIGAHMEKDIDLIIDVEPEEAQELISLIEMLISDWYINRHQRELRLKSAIAIANSKAEQKQIKPKE